MARASALFCLALSLLASTASGGDLDESEVLRHFAELERLVRAQEDQLRSQQARIAQLEEVAAAPRALADSTAATMADLNALSATLTSSQEELGASVDTVYVMLCAALVMFMQTGFAMLEAGCCREKNVQNVLLKNITDVAVATLGWWACGYALAYGTKDGETPGFAAGQQNWFGGGMISSDENGVITPTGGKTLEWFFQWTFSSAAATIVSGGVAERVRFPGYVIYSFAMSAFIYPVVVAWTWGGGWLSTINDVGFIDFSGSGVVHACGGVGALLGAIIAGPRTNRWDPKHEEEFVPHSFPLVVLGTLILWFGWYGFNCGSTLGLHTREQGELAAYIAMNTTLAPAMGGVLIFVISLVRTGGKYDLGGFCNGILAGLVSITAGCANVEGGSALMIGAIGACLYQLSSITVKRLQIDDPIDAFSVHGVSGMWGVVAAAMFDWGKGTRYAHGSMGFDCVRGEDGNCLDNANIQLIAANLALVAVVVTWVGGMSFCVFMFLRVTHMLRATDNVQELGMDHAKHSPSQAYSINDLKEISKTIERRVSAEFAETNI